MITSHDVYCNIRNVKLLKTYSVEENVCSRCLHFFLIQIEALFFPVRTRARSHLEQEIVLEKFLYFFVRFSLSSMFFFLGRKKKEKQELPES